MAQMTKEHAERIAQSGRLGKHSPLTAWEVAQLAHGWLQWHAQLAKRQEATDGVTDEMIDKAHAEYLSRTDVVVVTTIFERSLVSFKAGLEFGRSIAQPVKVPDLRADAISWGNALNEAAWVFTEECPEKSALLFNHTKAPLRLAILKYLELVSTSPLQPQRAVNAPFGNADHIPPVEGVEFMHFDNLSHTNQRKGAAMGFVERKLSEKTAFDYIDQSLKDMVTFISPAKLRGVVADEVVDLACEAQQVGVPDDWKPTPDNINALPLPVRNYIMALETNADPAGMVRENVLVSEENAALRVMLSETPNPSGESFQARVGDWMDRCFEHSLYGQMIERGDRVAEEVFEMLQAHHYPRERLATLIEYVYNRPIGEPEQEVGGVMITLSGFCHVAGHDMMACGERELSRINTPEVMAKIRAKQKAKNALHFDTPLPGAAGMEHAP